MKKQSAFVVLAVLCVGLGLVVVSSRGVRVALVVKQADAAYRDGAYQAKIDVDRGRKPHVSSGRWSTAVRKVLSTTHHAPASWATVEISPVLCATRVPGGRPAGISSLNS